MTNVESAFGAALQMARVSVMSSNPTLADLQRAAELSANMMEHMHSLHEPIDRARLLRELEGLFNVFQPSSGMLVDDSDHIPWLNQKQGAIQWQFWDRYVGHLQENEGLPPIVLQRLGESTRNILAHLENPERNGAWSRRGLVAGQVQSGKTSHYIGLMCRAVDAGYRIIVVLAGMDNNLRSQTQLRVDAGLLGFDTQRRMLAQNGSGLAQDALGAGRLVGYPSLPIASLTTSLESGDFKRTAANVGIRPDLGPIVAVVKKNVTVLRNLREWLESVCPRSSDGRIESYPMLMIDDEADSASVNTRQADRDPAAVNREIRLLLNLFARSAFVGYTATPFANIYINPHEDDDKYGEDLHPRSFIETLKAPSTYFGPSRLFGVDSDEDELPLHRPIGDHESWIPDKHKRDHTLGPLPKSLQDAMKSFILARAARIYRGQVTKHNSMLIHVTRFNDVQRQVRELVDDELAHLKARIKYGDGGGPSVSAELRELWERDFWVTSEAMGDSGERLPEWSEIEPLLVRASEPIVVRSINGDAKDVLDYFDNRESGFNVIAIGGNKLSRGLTLEGLTVSYYLRTTRMFDTLLQMGRWFGYRPGYEDLCRLYTTPRLWAAYKDVTAATNEMYRDFDEMCELGKTPTEYGLKVRDSVEGMIVTSPNKMINGYKLKIGFAGGLSPSTSIFADAKNGANNLAALRRLIETIDGTDCLSKGVRLRDNKDDIDSRFVWTGVPGDEIVKFFEEIVTPESAYRVNSSLIARFIRGRMSNDQLVDWTVLLASPRGTTVDRKLTSFGNRNVWHTVRRMPNEKGAKVATRAAWARLVEQGLYTVKTVVSPADETVDISANILSDLLNDAIANWERNGARGLKPTVPPGEMLRNAREPHRGLLMLYLIDSPWTTYGDQLLAIEQKVEITRDPLVGFAVSFPKITDAPAEDYVVTQRFMTELRGIADDEDDE